MGLAAVHHLDAVLGPPQEEVGVGDGVAVAGLHDAGEEQAVEGAEHGPLPDPRVAQLAPVEELERRDEELGLADAALAELEVVLALGAGAGVDAGLHGLDLLDDPQVERAAPDERLELGEELVAHRQVPGAGAGLHERVALPGPSEGLVVELGGPEAVHDGSAAPVGAEVQVDPEDHPVLGDPGEALGDQLGQLRVVGEVGEGALPGGRAVRPVDVDEVDVRREVELAGPQLAHGDGAEACPGGAIREPLGRPVTRPQATVVEGDGGLEGRGGERRERAGDLVDAGPPQVAQRDADHLAGGEAAQQPVQPVHVLGVEPPGGAGEDAPHGRLRALPPHPGRAGRAAQEPGVARQRRGGQPRRPGEQHQRLDQVASHGEARRRRGSAPRRRAPGRGRAPAGRAPRPRRWPRPGGVARRTSRSGASAARNGAGATPSPGTRASPNMVRSGYRRFTARGEKACCSGMSSRTFTFTWGGRVTAQWMASATSAPVSGVTPW